MIEQTYFLDMIPGESTPPVVHVSQFDVNSRTLTFNLMKGGVAYEPTAGMSVTLDGAKPDGTAFSYPMTVNGSAVSIDVKTQMTVVSGHVKCEVSVSNVSGKIGSANFILAVEEAAIDDGAISETDIPIFEDLKNQAQQAAASAEQSASDAETAASSVSSIVPASAGTTGQVLTKTTTGADWQDVDGLPAGGTTGQVLTKQSSTDGDADWETPTGGQWGQITGTLSNQTDLQTALSAKANASTLATVETGTSASQAYSAGDYLVYNGVLYEVTTAISSGQTLTPGTNISATTVGDELTSLNNGLTNVDRSTCTMAANWKTTQNRVVKKTGFVELYVECLFSGTYSSGWNHVCTIPAGYRPIETFDMVSLDNGVSTAPACDIKIEQGGAVRVYNNTGTSKNLRIHAVYIQGN